MSTYVGVDMAIGLAGEQKINARYLV